MLIKSVKEILANKTKQEVVVRGWVRSNRDSGKIGFIDFNDGTYFGDIQVVYKQKLTKGFDEIIKARTGSSILITGTAQPNDKNQDSFEILASEAQILKQADEDYPIQKKNHTNEFLREVAHLRTRTKFFTCINKVRNDLFFAIHNFFQQNDFMWVASPIITSNDCEGAGENFTILQEEKPFFDKPAKLTVSGQLNAEAFAQSYKAVYTFGPTFRAERSHTNRHMAEFWMVEPEIAFINLPQLISVIEDFIKNIVKSVRNSCEQEIKYLESIKENKTILDRMDILINKPFCRIEYKEAIDILSKAVKEGHPFEDTNIFFGKDLASEHERYICEKVFNAPTFICNYPKDIKAFYMKVNDDNKTVAATDLLVPGVGEIVGGSQREDDYEKLLKRCNEMKIDQTSIEWYLELRKYGYFSSAGFGLGFERLIMYILDLDNIRDTIPFPRSDGSLKF